MAKKRKLRSSEPESSKTPEPIVPKLEPVQEPEPEPEPEPEQQQYIKEEEVEEEEQHDNMDEDEAGGEGEGEGEGEEEVEEEVEEDEEEGEEQADEEDEDEVEQADEVTAEANGSGGKSIAVVDANDGGGDSDDDDSDEEPLEKVLEPFSKEQLAALVKEAVEKFPEFVNSVRKIADADPAHRKIFVHGLGWDTTAETLVSEFGKYGEIEDCKAVTDKVSGKSKGYAFILFKHRSGARKALKEPQKKIGSRMTSCQLASAGPVPAPPPVATPVSEYTQRKIFVSNVSSEIDPEKLLEFFKQYGEIEDGPLGLDKQTGKPKGFALFVYKSPESAKKALDEPHKNFEGHTLHCQKAIDGPKQNKQFHQQQQQQHYQPHYPARKEKNKYMSGGSAGPGHSHGPGHGHLMAPSGPGVGFNPAIAAQALNPALGQALTALFATQGAGLGLNNLLGGLGGAPMNQGGPPVMNNALYGNQAGGSYGNPGGMQGGYQNPQMGQSSGVRGQPGVGNMGGPPYMGH